MGAGLIIDIVVTYIWWSTLRLWLELSSRRWIRSRAVVLKANVSKQFSLGCPLVEIIYKVDGVGESAARIPFLLRGFAEDYAQSFRSNDVVVVRTSLKAIKRTAFFLSDQI
jgi:hypothetical protein